MSLPSRVPPRASLEARLAEVEDRLAIQDLVARYNLEVDSRDLQALGELFTEGGSFGTQDGVMRADGRQAVLQALEQRFTVLGATHHVSHDHVIWFDGATRARGLLSAHAELWRNERAVIAALRYHDVYEKADGLWRFSERLLSYMYYLPVEDYASALGRLDRNRAGPVPAPADFPEKLPTYVERRPTRS